MFKDLAQARIKVLDVDAGVVEATVSDESEDRDGDIIRAGGWVLDHFHKHPVLLADHDYSIESTIGRWDDMRVTDGELRGVAKYQIGRGNTKADRAFAIAQDGDAAYSVGFIPMESTPRKGVRGYEFTKQELLEVSQVAVPSNRNARQLIARAAKRLGVDTKWPMDDGGWMGHCIVVGCDDGALLSIPICEEHLKYLVNSPGEPNVGQPAEEAFGDALAKAGRVLSGSNLDRLHHAMSDMAAVHDGACDGGDDCPVKSVFHVGHKAAWDTSYINDLPDSAFAVILPGGEKDADGKTKPRSLRMLPHHDADGKIDDPHLRNALSRLPQADMPEADRAKAEKHLDAHAKAEGIGEDDSGKSITTQGPDPAAFKRDFANALQEALRG